MSSLVYIGAQTIVSPLGNTAFSNYEQLLASTTAIRKFEGAGWKGSDVCLSRIEDLPPENRFSALLVRGLNQLLECWDMELLSSPETLVILSSTKGEVTDALLNPFKVAVLGIKHRFSLFTPPLLISNACISGVLAINVAADLIRAHRYRHVVVLGCDVLSEFVLYGFQSLYAVSESPCRPFDANRAGVTLGEGFGGVVLSSEPSSFRQAPFVYLGGADANDANHISGPSRTGEGLLRAVDLAIDRAGIAASEIAYINTHGTGTLFNDEMESIAFGRAGLSEVPLNSLKGYWGHTLGAAGVIETAACLQTLETGQISVSAGFETPGTSVPVNIVMKNSPLAGDVILKTASGFGGGNAALLLKRL